MATVCTSLSSCFARRSKAMGPAGPPSGRMPKMSKSTRVTGGQMSRIKSPTPIFDVW